MGFYIGNVYIDSKLVLAPLAGYTNAVYRNLCGDNGAGLVYSEMISDKGLLYDNDKTFDMASGKLDKYPVSIQIFGYDIDTMVTAALKVEKECDANIIDINMGCPVRKVLKAQAGSYLLQDINHAAEMVREIKKAIKIPLTAKIRTGWDHDSINCVEMAKALEEAGIDAIAIHGRTKSDMYSNKVDLDLIKKVKEAVKIPVIGNGDIKTKEDAKYFLEYTGVDAIMIGRATFGNPWIFKEMKCYLEGTEFIPPTLNERIETLYKHIDSLIELKGEKIAILEMRTIAIWYVKGLRKLKEFKEQVVKAKTRAELVKCIEDLLLLQ